MLLEVKTICLSVGRYPDNTVTSISPVNTREIRIEQEYKAKAALLDRIHWGVVNGSGRFSQRYADLNGVMGLVVGHFSEFSSNFKRLINLAASAIARKSWKQMGVQDEVAALSRIFPRLYRKWGICASQARARALCNAVQMVIDPCASSEGVFRRAYADRCRHAYISGRIFTPAGD